jgi:hypothetical protein
MFMGTLEQNLYEDTKKMLLDFEKWLRAINQSAADSLREALEGSTGWVFPSCSERRSVRPIR